MPHYQTQIESAFKNNNTDTIERIIGRLNDLDYQFDANRVRDYGELSVTNMLNPIELDMSKVANAKSEKEVLKIFKDTVSKISEKEDRLLERVVIDALKEFKGAADGKK